MTQRTVILVDDDTTFRQTLTPKLEALGLNVMSTSKGSEALSLVEENPPDVALVDGLLPDTNGIRWIEEVRSKGFSFPIIFVSAFYRDLGTFRRLTQELSVDAVLHKPLSISRVVREVARSAGVILPESYADDHIDQFSLPPPPNEEALEILFLEEADQDLGSFAVSQEGYAKTLPASGYQLRYSVRRIKENRNRPSLVWRALREAHNIYGVSGSFGYERVSNAAAQIESRLREYEAGNQIDWKQVDSELLELVKYAEQAAQEIVVSETSKQIDDSVQALSGAHALQYTPLPSRLGPSILLIDEEPSMAVYLRTVLEGTMVNIRSVANAHGAKQALQERVPDAIIISWPASHPEQITKFLNGLELGGSGRTLPLMILSLGDEKAARKYALEWEADLFLKDPPDPLRIKMAIEHLTELAVDPVPHIALLGNEELANSLRASGVEVLHADSLDSLELIMNVEQPHIVLVSSEFQDETKFRMLRMSAWDIEFDIVGIKSGEEVTVKEFLFDDVLEQDDEWISRLLRRARQVAYRRGRVFRSYATGLANQAVVRNALYSGLVSAQRQGHSYTIGFAEAIAVERGPERDAELASAELARVLHAGFRGEDTLGHWDRHRFVFGLSGGTAETMMHAVKRVQNNYLSIVNDRGPVEAVQQGFAVGLAAYPLDGDSMRALLMTAHRRLNAASLRPPHLVWSGLEASPE